MKNVIKYHSIQDVHHCYERNQCLDYQITCVIVFYVLWKGNCFLGKTVSAEPNYNISVSNLNIKIYYKSSSLKKQWIYYFLNTLLVLFTHGLSRIRM